MIIRFINRLVLWLKILNRLQGVTIESKLGIAISAIRDIIIYSFHPNSALSPKSYFSEIVRSKKFNIFLVCEKGNG